MQSTIKKKFQYNGFNLFVVDREEPYMNNGLTVCVRRVLNEGGLSLPVNIQNRQTLKSIVEDSIRFLDDMVQKGFDVAGELARKYETPEILKKNMFVVTVHNGDTAHNINIDRPTFTVFVETEQEAIEAMQKSDFYAKHLPVVSVVQLTETPTPFNPFP